jgi:xylulokinase
VSDLFAGLDVSTQSAKLVAIEPATGTVRHVDRVDYDRDLPRYGTVGGAVPGLGEGVSESDPLMWLEAVETLLGRMRSAGIPADRICCISVSGQQHGLVTVDLGGGLARPRAKLWNDVSTADECRILIDAVGGLQTMLAEVGNSQRPGYTASKILHLKRHEPDRYARVRTVLLPHNYVNWHLTGGPAGGVAVMEPGDTSGMALWHPAAGQWSQPVIEAIDPDLARRLPPVLPSDRTIGNVAPALAARFGLSPACRVDAGSGDNMYGAVGTGNVTPGILTVSLGTSGTAYTMLTEPFVDPSGEIAAFCDSTGHHLPLVCVSNMAGAYDAVRARLGLSHEAFDALIERTRPGNSGQVLVPWFVGERTPDLPLATPFAFGFDLGNPAPEVLCRAVLEGLVLNLHAGCSRLPVAAREIRLTGGLAGSPAWRQAIADVFGVEAVPVGGEGAALGAAIHAAWVWSKEASRAWTLGELCAAFVQPDESRRCRPIARHREIYAVLRRLFRALTDRVRGLPGDDPLALRGDLLRLTAATGTRET